MNGATSQARIDAIRAGTHATIDLDAYESNLKELARLAGSDKALMAIVKANAYGHGAVECATAAIEAGCTQLGVARIDEALQLRRAGLTAPILVIGPPNIPQIPVALEVDIGLTIATEEAANALLMAASVSSKPAVVHLKIDTGLHRYGAMPDLALRLGEMLDSSPAATLEGVYTHFSSADEEDATPTLDQIARFRSAVGALREADIRPRFLHVANSAATLEGLLDGTNMVRAGIASYGLDPSDEIPVTSGFRQILSLRSVIARRFTLPAGESVSYNRTYTASTDEEVASVPIGYADGIERHLSNRGRFIHREGACPIIGRVCMDQTVVRLPSGAKEGDPVVVIGDGRDGSMTVADIGRLSDTNTYEPVTRIAARVPRLYLRAGEPVSWSVPLLGEFGDVTS